MGKFANFSSMGLHRRRALEDEDPLSGLVNLSDCMLVLACGLMVALVVAWNIDIQNVTQVEATDKTEVTDVTNIDGNFESGGTTYVDVGRVYQDPETGTYYILEDADSQSSDAGGSASSAGVEREGDDAALEGAQ